MDNRDGLLVAQRELQEVGQEAYQFEQRCPHCQAQFTELWERLEWIDLKVQKLLSIEEENGYLRYRINRYLDFGEALDDLL